MEHPFPDTASIPAAMRQMIDGYRVSQLICVAAELGIADLLKGAPRHYEDLARATGSRPDALHRLLCALAGLGVFARLPGGHFSLNALAESLVGDAPGSLRAWAIASGGHWYGAWGHLRHTVKTGETAFKHVNGVDAWLGREQDPVAGRAFNDAMSTFAALTACAVTECYDFSRFRTVIDVGGGQGTLLAAILEAAPATRGILLDLEPAIKGARALLQRAELAHRCELVAGSFFDGVPAAGDAYVLSRVIHDWDDEDAIRILGNVRRAMKEEGKLIVIERIMDPDIPGAEVALSDVNMMVMNGGRERSVSEFRRLLGAAGFELLQTIVTPAVVNIIEAKAAVTP
jgi:hypothetical protein